MFDPAFGFGGFEFEFGDGFNGVTGRKDFGFVGVEFECDVFGAGEGAVGFFVETGRDGVDGVCEDRIELDVEFVDGEAGFYGG